MYAGRDNRYDPIRNTEDFALMCRLIHRDEHSITVDHIHEKLPLGDYLREGLRIAGRLRLDLDAENWDATKPPSRRRIIGLS